MPNLGDLVSQPIATPAENGAQIREGVVRNTPAATTDDLFVTVESFTGDQKLGPCRWTPRDGDLPVAGDKCVVQDSSDGRLHVVIWLQPH